MQLEFLLSQEAGYRRAQDDKKLDQFWPRILEEWFHRWGVPKATPAVIAKSKSPEDAATAMQKKRTKVRDD